MVSATATLPCMPTSVGRVLKALFRTVRAFSLPPIFIEPGTLPKIRLREEQMTWLRSPPPADAGPWLSHVTLAERRYEYSFVTAADDEAITALQALLEKLLTARARNPVNPRPQGALWPAVNGYPFTIEGRVPGIAAAGETSFGGLWVDIGLADPAETEVHRGKSWIASCFIDPRLDVYQSS